jgi:hypothetical protein
VKTVAAVTVVAATTATVAATDPGGIWRAKPDPVEAKATKPFLRATSAPPAASSGSVWAPADAALRPQNPEAEQSHRSRDASARGREFGQTTAAKAKDKGAGNGLALGHEKKASASPKASNAQGPPASAGRPSTRPAAPPAHAQANGLAKSSSRTRSG